VLRLSSAESRESWEIPVLYQDEYLLALDKPARLPVTPDPREPAGLALTTLLHRGVAEGKPWARERSLGFLASVNRMDSEATGVVLFAQSKEVLRQLSDLFGADKPVRLYVALVDGSPGQNEFDIQARIGPHPTREAVMRVNPGSGKHCHTRVRVLERFSKHTLLECAALTDRPHQLRVHLAHVRLPITGDSVYRGRPLLLSKLKSGYRLKPGHQERPLIDRPALHAERLEFPHPVAGTSLALTAPWPKALTVAVKYLRRYG